MVTARAAGLLAVAVAACAGQPRTAARPDASVTLYRDGALIEERLQIAIGADGVGEVGLVGEVATADLTIDAEPGTVTAWTRRATGVGDPVEVEVAGAPTVGRLLGVTADGVAVATDDAAIIARSPTVRVASAVLRVTSPRRNARVTVVVRYRATRLAWSARYTLLQRPAGDLVTGALRLDNRTGRSWARAAIAVVDAAMTGPNPAEEWSRRHPLALTTAAPVVAGAQRLELPLAAAPVSVATTLTYAPLGPEFNSDRIITTPDYPPGPSSTAVESAVAIELPRAEAVPLPGGQVDVLAVDRDGAPRWLGQVTLPGATADGPRTVAVSLGRAAELSGSRTQSMFDHDPRRRRTVEEIRITLTNRTDRAERVVVREQLFRGVCWGLAYYSTPTAAREAPQQVRLVAEVPAHGTETVVYRVVYKSGPCTR